MRYNPINSILFSGNRENFISKLKVNAIALFNSNDQYLRSGDQTFPFRQNSDFFYLTGIDQEESILLLFPDCPNPLHKEALFIRQTNEHIKVWEGHKYTKEKAAEVSGIKQIYWLDEFWAIFSSIVNYSDTLYLNTNENDRSTDEISTRDLRFIDTLKKRYPLHEYKRAAPILREMRCVKSDIEVELTRRACSITKDAFKRVLKFVKPGVKEYEIEAEIIHEFIRQGATGHAYSPIIASGANATILHYNDNNQICKDGDVILFDFGAEYANYNADLSRAIPVNGKFTKRQSDIYKAVLHVFKEARKMLVSGTVWSEYQTEVGKIMSDQLVQLGLFTKFDVEHQNPDMPLYKKYFMHGTSHHLGLDVHDFASRYRPFEPGNILTCEPGIYIKEEGIGIRLENDILITADGNIDLLADIPIEPEEIEELMNS